MPPTAFNGASLMVPDPDLERISLHTETGSLLWEWKRVARWGNGVEEEIFGGEVEGVLSTSGTRSATVPQAKF